MQIDACPYRFHQQFRVEIHAWAKVVIIENPLNLFDGIHPEAAQAVFNLQRQCFQRYPEIGNFTAVFSGEWRGFIKIRLTGNKGIRV